MRSRITTLLLTALLLALPLAATAQWTNDPWNGMAQVAASSEPDQYPQLVRLSTGYTLVIWIRMDEIKIKYQVVNPSGVSLLGQDGQYIVDGDWETGYERFLIPDGVGGAICVFDDLRDGYKDIYGQRFDTYGNRLWGPTGLPLVVWPEDDAHLRDVAADSLGNGFISWGKNLYPINELYTQKFDLLTGERTWGDMGMMDCGGVSFCGCQQIVADGQGGVITVWQDQRITPYAWYLYAQHRDADGNPLWQANGMPVLHPSGQHIWVGGLWEAVPDGEGGGYWAFDSPGYSSYLLLFRMTGEGQTLWSMYLSRSYPRGFIDMLVHPNTGNVWLSDKETRWGESDYYIYQIDRDGNALFGFNGLNYGGSLTAVSGGVMTAQVNHGPQGTQLAAERVDTSGNLLWTADVALGELTVGGGPVYAEPVGVPDDNDGAIITFEDRRQQATNGTDISAQRVLWDGTLGSPKSTRPVIYPSLDGGIDFSGSILHYTLPKAGKIMLELFDILGRRVALIEEGYRRAGSHVVHLTNQNLPSGIYLLHLTTPSTRQTTKIVIVR